MGEFHDANFVGLASESVRSTLVTIIAFGASQEAGTSWSSARCSGSHSGSQCWFAIAFSTGSSKLRHTSVWLDWIDHVSQSAHLLDSMDVESEEATIVSVGWGTLLHRCYQCIAIVLYWHGFKCYERIRRSLAFIMDMVRIFIRNRRWLPVLALDTGPDGPSHDIWPPGASQELNPLAM